MVEAMAGLLKVRAVHVRRCSAAQEVGVLAAVNTLKLGLNLLQSRPSHVSTIWIMDPLTSRSIHVDAVAQYMCDNYGREDRDDEHGNTC
jgi:hypothetical protein